MELLAPAGTLDCLKTAVNCGADAVYFGGQSFGARSFAGNLTDEEIYYATDYCHLRGVRTYVTVNTLVYDRELKELERFVKTLTYAGVDGVIVQDLGVLRLIGQMSPDLELHGSTQMTVHSLDGVRELEKTGVCRVVLSRELSKSEIEYITQNAKAETEVFVHGAMCMSYSGQCLMSSVIGGRSGNRGKCAQPCRLPYSAENVSSKFYLSLKDMSLADYICELKAMGVASLKIEGRMKGEEYVSAVVSAYRRLIDEERKPTREEIERLNRVFFRGGLTDGYYRDKKGADMFAFDKPDNPYLKNDTENVKQQDKKLPVNITVKISEGDYPVAEISSGRTITAVKGDSVAETASKRAVDREMAEKQFSRLGDTAFYAESIRTEISGMPYLSASQLNDLRRRSVSALESELLKPYKSKRLNGCDFSTESAERTQQGYSCSVMNTDQYRAVENFDFKRIYVPINIIEENADSFDRSRTVIALPVIMRGGDREAYRQRLCALREKGYTRAEISALDGLGIVDGFEVYTNHRTNITNGQALAQLYSMGVKSACLSAELNLAQMADIAKSGHCEALVYGRIPLMITENCILKNMGKCPCNGAGEITDRTGARLPVVKDGEACRSIVFNSLPVYAGDKTDELKRFNGDLRLNFTVESREECENICRIYIDRAGEYKGEFTRFRLFKGALD